MIKEIEQTLKKALPKDYFVTFDETHMFNLKADLLQHNGKFAYIEEYRTGRYDAQKYGATQKTTKIEIVFGQLTELHNEAKDRETIREEVEREAILPFIKAWNDVIKAKGQAAAAYTFTASFGRFDANEVSVTLTFDNKEVLC